MTAKKRSVCWEETKAHLDAFMDISNYRYVICYFNLLKDLQPEMKITLRNETASLGIINKAKHMNLLQWKP